ncbi:MAG: isoleucine--tRNA ligase [Patescibacteria group bacterium]|nr:isoleucine--tRNA ligase [Patescibacteria group bacterium]
MSDNIQKKGQFSLIEEEVLDFWDKSKTFEQSLTKSAKHGSYVFYDGPPFATGTPHYGHIVASLMKDVVPRFWTMRGYRVDRKWGWDCHGLPIENIVEKELGYKSKKDIEALGVDKFNEACRSKVFGYVDDWKRVINRLGRWVDMENAYKTMDLSYMESVWWTFKELWDKGLIYEGYRSMHICPRCETTLSQSEVAEGYRDVKDLSAIAKFKLSVGQKIGDFTVDDNTFVLAWTTTPWTLIANVALAVGKNIEYVLVKSDSMFYILAKDLIEQVFKDKDYNIEHKFIGEQLVGLKYEPLYGYYAKRADLPKHDNGWKIVTADFVTTTDGTGVVHIAPAFGEDDLNLGLVYDLPFVQHVGMDGFIKAEAGEFAGLQVKPTEDPTKTDIEIIKNLAARNLLFAKAKYEHSYPYCWRCDTPLLNYATSSWFVNVSKIKDQALKTAETINWSPNHIKAGRFGQWLAGARDWSISRQRFWAGVLPIWRCACGEIKCVGSVAELKELSGVEVNDLHKHIVDKVTIPCYSCHGQMKRIPDVLDCWFESGSMPYAQHHYPFENKEYVESNFPAEFIAEGVDQTRCWFYYLHIIANGLWNKAAFKNVIVNGIALAEDGKKMSKKLKNYPDPMFVLDKYGADALRLYLLSSPVMQAENFNFFEKGVEESLRKNIMLLWNIYKFYETYQSTADSLEPVLPQSKNILDKWIIARWQVLNLEVEKAMEQYNLPKAVRPITEFIDELSTWYLRRSRDRLRESSEAVATMRFVLTELAKLLAPFAPFIAESLWQKTTGYNFNNQAKSVHLVDWNKTEPLADEKNKILAEMLIARKVVELGLVARDEAKLKIRQPLSSMEVLNCQLPAEYEDIIKDELNIKSITLVSGEEKLSIKLDTKITPELKAEGLERDLIRHINLLRKSGQLTVNDEIVIYHDASGLIADVLNKQSASLMNSTVSKSVINSMEAGLLLTIEVKLDETKFNLGIKKIN